MDDGSRHMDVTARTQAAASLAAWPAGLFRRTRASRPQKWLVAQASIATMQGGWPLRSCCNLDRDKTRLNRTAPPRSVAQAWKLRFARSIARICTCVICLPSVNATMARSRHHTDASRRGHSPHQFKTVATTDLQPGRKPNTRLSRVEHGEVGCALLRQGALHV